MANFNVNIISGSVEIREGELTLSNSESTINVRTELNKKEVTTNKTLALTSESDHQQYPSAKAVVDYVSASAANIPDAAVIIEGTYSRDSWKIVYDTASLQASEILVESGAYSKGYAAVEADTPVYLHLTRAQSRIAGADPSPSEYFLPLVEYSTDFLNFLGPEGIHVRVSSIDTARADMDYASFISNLWYDSGSKKIYFENPYRVTGSIDATAFIKDGMVDTVTINTGSNQMIITFNTEAGKEDITLDLTDIFDPNNYFTKDEIYAITASMDLGDHNVIEAIEFNGTASSVSNKTASINVTLPDAPNQNAENWVTENSASLVTESVWVRGTGTSSAILSGSPSVADAQGAVAHGNNATASGQFSHAEGWRTRANNVIAHAEGSASVASGIAAHAEGRMTTASGYWSHTEGSRSVAFGQASHAEGRGTRAEGTASHAEGWSTTSSGHYSHAEGQATKALGSSSHAEGVETIASGSYSHAEGNLSIAYGNYSHVEGFYTLATNTYELSVGKCNVTASGQIFSVGVGDDGNRRKNAISIITGSGEQSSASIYVYGVGSYDGTNPQPGVNDLATVISASSSGGSSDDWYTFTTKSIASRTVATVIPVADHTTIQVQGEQKRVSLTANTAENSAGYYTASSIVVRGTEISLGFDYISDADGDLIGSTALSIRDDIISTNCNISTSADILARSFTGSLQGTATTASYNQAGADAKSWITANSSSALAVSPASVTASINAAIGGITASHHTHSNKAVLDGITAAKTASWDSAATSATALNSILASLIASGTLAKNVTAITASLVASASVAKTASSSAAAISAKTGSWDALVGLPAVTAADNGKILRIVSGAWALVDPVTVYSGQGAPDSALGQDGDIYLQS